MTLSALRRMRALNGAVYKGRQPRNLPSALRSTARRGFGVAPFASPNPVHFSSDPNAIVTVNVSTVVAPTPNSYQQCGCFVTWGGTTMPAQSVQELTSYDDLALVLEGPLQIGSAAWSAGVVTITLTQPLAPKFLPTDVVYIQQAGCTPSTYNVLFVVATIVDALHYTYQAATDPGALTTPGTAQPYNAVELTQQASTFFAQGNAVSVWVLELGYGANKQFNAPDLQTWLTNNPNSFYGYLLPRVVGEQPANIQSFESIFAQYDSPESMTYFWCSVRTQAFGALATNHKCVIQLASAVANFPTDRAVGAESSIASMFYIAMAFTPSNTNRVAPMAFRFVYGVTPWPTQNQATTLAQMKSLNINYIAQGAEGGVSDTMIYQGVTLDGNDYFNWWWTIDWVQININLNVSNTIINGSNNPLAPLYYDDDGINRLLSSLYATMNAAKTFGMVQGQMVMTKLDGPDLTDAISAGQFAGMCDVNAVPFLPYSLANPGHYKIGEYDGLSTLFIPLRGFIHVLVNVVASQLVTV